MPAIKTKAKPTKERHVVAMIQAASRNKRIAKAQLKKLGIRWDIDFTVGDNLVARIRGPLEGVTELYTKNPSWLIHLCLEAGVQALSN